MKRKDETAVSGNILPAAWWEMELSNCADCKSERFFRFYVLLVFLFSGLPHWRLILYHLSHLYSLNI